MTSNDNYEFFASQMPIDQLNLSAEIAKQPELYFTSFETAIALKNEYDQAKTCFDQVQAEADLRIRQELLESGTKTTEGLVASRVICDPAVLSQKEKMEALYSEYSRWNVLKDAFLQRSIMLRTLAELEIAQMRSSDAIVSTTSIKEEMAEQRRKS